MDTSNVQLIEKISRPKKEEDLVFDENIHGFDQYDFEAACKVIKSLLEIKNGFLIHHTKTKVLTEGISSFNKGYYKR